MVCSESQSWKIHSPFLEMYLNIKGKNKNKKKIQAKQDKKENKKKKAMVRFYKLVPFSS